MRILLNATTIIRGGALQRANSVLLEALADREQHCWCIALSRRVYDEVRRFEPPGCDDFHVFDVSPARSRDSRRRLLKLEAEFGPDCVYSVGAPAYVKFRAPHLLTCTEPWVSHPTWLAYRTMSFPHEWIAMALRTFYKAYWFRHADAWVTQSEIASRGLHRRLRLSRNNIAVVPNTCGPQYLDSQSRRPFPAGSGKVRLLCFAASYTWKRLDLIPRVAKELARRDPTLDFEFVITLPFDDATLKQVMSVARSLDVVHLIHNEGQVPVALGPKLYRRCDMCFLPTLLESFSAAYPEAMAMGLPIVTTNLAFARDICGDAALYFEPNDPSSAAATILDLLREEPRWNGLIAKGKKTLAALPTSHQRHDLYMDLLGRLVESGRLSGQARGESNSCRC